MFTPPSNSSQILPHTHQEQIKATNKQNSNQNKQNNKTKMTPPPKKNKEI